MDLRGFQTDFHLKIAGFIHKEISIGKISAKLALAGDIAEISRVCLRDHIVVRFRHDSVAGLTDGNVRPFRQGTHNLHFIRIPTERRIKGCAAAHIERIRKTVVIQLADVCD